MRPIPLLVELCAGTAALSLRLHEEGARPPVSRMGAKTGYADIILERMGLVPGQTADAYLWCEPDPGVRLLLLAYTDRTLARSAADVIRGWAKEDPRALWERLKAEGPVRAPDPREVARWAWVQSATAFRKGWGSGFAASTPARMEVSTRRMMAEEERRRFAEWLKESRTSRGLTRSEGDQLCGKNGACRWWEGVGSTSSGKGQQALPSWPMWLVLRGLFGGGEHWDEKIRPDPGTWKTSEVRPGRVADKVDALPELPARLMPDASEVDPRELARWARILTSNRLVNPDPVTWTNTGDGGYRFGGEFADPVERLAEGWDLPELPAKVSPGAEAVDPREVARWTVDGSWAYLQGIPFQGFCGPGDRRQDTRPETIAGKLDALPELPATALVEAVEPPRRPEGSWVYIDPPYQGTTGYAHDLPREEVVRLARLWREAGAHVCISEAEPIPDLVAEGWHVVEITGDRKGQKRTFSKQKREFLTMSREPRGQLGFWGLS